MELLINKVDEQFSYFPGTRYMGSKNKIISDLGDILLSYKFSSFLDAFAGSNVVGYFMKSAGKKVVTNDFMAISYIVSKAIIENSKSQLENEEIDFLLKNDNGNSFISKQFNELYFDSQDNKFLDRVRGNVDA